MIFDHEHHHPPSTPSVYSAFAMRCAHIAVTASLMGIALILVQSLTRVLW